jgi:hypothetical protein
MVNEPEKNLVLPYVRSFDEKVDCAREDISEIKAPRGPDRDISGGRPRAACRALRALRLDCRKA